MPEDLPCLVSCVLVLAAFLYGQAHAEADNTTWTIHQEPLYTSRSRHHHCKLICGLCYISLPWGPFLCESFRPHSEYCSLTSQSPNEIVFSLDLHLTIPVGLVESIRKVSINRCCGSRCKSGLDIWLTIVASYCTTW